MAPRTFRELDHSGDAGIEAWGGTVAELLENMTRGLFTLQSRTGAARVIAHEIEILAENETDLLVDWLSEVIAVTTGRGMTYGDVVVTSVEGTRAKGILYGEPSDPARHDLRFDVKAATYHKLTFEHTAAGFHAQVIFDL